MIVVPAGIAYERRHDLSWSRDWPLILIGAVTILTSDYSSSYADAQRAVLDFNEQHEAAFEDAHPDAP